MKKIFWIAGILVFILVAGFIAVQITKQQIKRITQKETERFTKELIEKRIGDTTHEEIKKLTQEEIDKISEERTKQIMNQILGGKPEVVNVQQVNWAGHTFETGVLSTSQYKTDGNKDVKFTDKGFYAPSYSLPRSKLLDVNINQKTKVKITADFEGEMKSSNEGCTGYCITTESYHFSEFGLYLIDESGNKMGMRVLGTRHNIARGNDKTEYKFTGFEIENTEGEIMLTDSTGFKINYSEDFAYVTSPGAGKEMNNGRYTYSPSGSLNPSEKWFLGINCHVNGVGYCKLEIKEIQII